MENLIQHLKETGIDLPENFTQHQLRILCETVIRHCESSIENIQWAEPGDLIGLYGLD